MPPEHNGDKALLKLAGELQEASKGGIGFIFKLVVAGALVYTWMAGTNATANQALERTKEIQSQLQNKADKKDIENINLQLQEIRGYLIKK